MLRQRMMSWVRMALLGTVVSLAFGAVAWGQSWGRYDDDDYYNRHDEAREHGFKNGYRDGQRAGRHQRDRDHQDRPPVVSTVHGRQCRTKVPVVSLPAGCQLLPQELSDFPAADYSRAASV